MRGWKIELRLLRFGLKTDLENFRLTVSCWSPKKGYFMIYFSYIGMNLKQLIWEFDYKKAGRCWFIWLAHLFLNIELYLTLWLYQILFQMVFLWINFNEIPLCVLKKWRIFEALVYHKDLSKLNYRRSTCLFFLLQCVPRLAIKNQYIRRSVTFKNFLVKESEFRIFRVSQHFIKYCHSLRFIQCVNKL